MLAAKLTSIKHTFGVILEHMQDSCKLNVFCAVSKKRVYGSFLFEEERINVEAQLAMLQNWLIEKSHEEESVDLIFQQDEAPPHWSLKVCRYLHTTLPDSWSDVPDRLFPCSSDGHLCLHISRLVTSSSGRFMEGPISVTPLPRDANDLKT